MRFLIFSFSQSLKFALTMQGRMEILMKKRVLITMTVYILAALCFFAYGMMIFNTGSGTKFYLVWYALGVVMLIAAAAVRWQIWQGLPVLLRRLLISGVLLGAITVISTWALIFTEFNSKGKPDLDYIIVLGAQVRASGPSVILKYRLDTAVDYLNANPNTKCIVSGGQGYNEPEPEGVVMKKYLMENGIDERRIRRYLPKY